MITPKVAAGRLLGLLAFGVPPTDPFGPTAQDPDQIRTAACKIVDNGSACTPSTAPVSSSTSSAGGGSDILSIVLWIILIAALIAIALVIARSVVGGSRSRNKDETDDEADPDDDALLGTVVIDRSREPSTWREQAEAHRAAGRFREALRCRYRALVGDLARRGLLDEIPGRTTGEERRQLRVTAPDASADFRDAAELFDGAWYGNIAVSVVDDDRFRQLETAVLTSAPTLAHRVPRLAEVGS